MTGKNRKGMTLVEVVVSMSILALTVAVTFAGISMSLKMINRAGEVRSEYEQVVEKMQDTSEGTDTDVKIKFEGDTGELSGLVLDRVEVAPDSGEESIIGSFYYYRIK